MWSPQCRTDIDLLECIQRRTKKIIHGVECHSYKNRLRELGLFSLEKKGLWGDLKAALQYMKGGYKKEGDRLFIRVYHDRTRGNSFKVKEGRFRLSITKMLFTIRVVRLPREVVEAPSLETFKVRLNRALNNLM